LNGSWARASGAALWTDHRAKTASKEHEELAARATKGTFSFSD